jgi:3' terminal RNA ribose 2'-O-methyltransferase Hen1
VLLTISTTLAPATDLGYLLHKHPDRPQSSEVSVGTAHVFYPEASDERCTAALLLDVDPIALVRGRRGGGSEGFSLAQYVNDRPYAASSLLAVALARVFKTAMSGRCDARPETAAAAMPLEIRLPSLPCRGGADIAERVFAPLGWVVDARPIALDPEISEWGDSPYLDLRIIGRLRLCDALNQLYVLLPVLDDAKHYWVGPDEVDKLVAAGGSWLGEHPERSLITSRYLKHQRSLVNDATTRLLEHDDGEPDPVDVPRPARTAPLRDVRRAAVLQALRESGASRVVDWGCGEGALVAELMRDQRFSEIVGVDVSARALDRAARRLALDQLSDAQRRRTRLVQSSLTYTDTRLAGFDAAALVEVIEHVDPDRRGALEQCVFGAARPATVIVTTPNAEFNARFTDLEPGGLRHLDHRFEWTRTEFHDWTAQVGTRYGYRVQLRPVGDEDPEVGPPTQLAIFTCVTGAAEGSAGGADLATTAAPHSSVELDASADPLAQDVG